MVKCFAKFVWFQGSPDLEPVNSLIVWVMLH
jgi:hypothetical protein